MWSSDKTSKINKKQSQKNKISKILNTEVNRQGQNEKWVTVSKGKTDKEEEVIK